MMVIVLRAPDGRLRVAISEPGPKRSCDKRTAMISPSPGEKESVLIDFVQCNEFWHLRNDYSLVQSFESMISAE